MHWTYLLQKRFVDHKTDLSIYNAKLTGLGIYKQQYFNTCLPINKLYMHFPKLLYMIGTIQQRAPTSCLSQ